MSAGNRFVRWAAAGLLLLPGALPAQIPGIPAGEADDQRARESRIVAGIQPALLDSLGRELSARPHVAGGEGQERVRDAAAAHLRGWGLRTEVPLYDVYLPRPSAVSLTLLRPGAAPREMRLREETLPSDPATALDQYPWVNGYSGAGEAEAEVVFANYGLHDDYDRLAEAGVSVEGRIVLARYGRSFRGVKARLAEEHGAAGLVLYSDPADDGYVRGDVYPDGPYRHPTAVQRGSVMNGPGDPSTPGWASVAGAPREDPLRPGSGVPRIPVVPVGYAVAREILEGLGGTDIPSQAWQGGLPLRYHLGPGPARLRMSVTYPDDGYHTIANVVATIPGRDFPDEWVVVGGHMDAWGAGANDNVSGTASVLAAASALSRLADEGWRPRRTLVFALWDAEEWGLIGSSEWVEEHRDELDRGGVAYLNQDGIAGGPAFGAGASPSLKTFLARATEAVPHPDGETLLAAWSEAQDGAAVDSLDLGNLGGGSDYAGFYNHVGVPSTSHGFGGGGGVYHSAYDTYAWMSRFGDPGFRFHAASSRLTAVMALRLAEALVLPYDYDRFGREMAGAARLLAEGEEDPAASAAVLEAARAFEGLAAAGETMNAARSAALAGAGIPRDRAARVNAHLLRVERALTRPEGLDRRPWYHNLVFAADYRNGYATIALPSIAEAVRSGDPARIVREARDLSARIESAREHLLAALGEIR